MGLWGIDRGKENQLFRLFALIMGGLQKEMTSAQARLHAALELAPPRQFVPVHGHAGLGLTIHRLDQITPGGVGNKVYKLLGHIEAAQRHGKNQLLSFGGAYSNHLHALAACASAMGWGSIGVVRGLHADPTNPTLLDLSNNGMIIHRVGKDEYLRRHEKDYQDLWRQKYPDAWLIPEGGNDRYGRLGLRALARALQVSIPADETLVVPVGTGATVRGLMAGLDKRIRVVAVLVAKDRQLFEQLSQLEQRDYRACRVVDGSGRGFARPSADELHSAETLFAETGVLLDPVYGCKAFQVASTLAQQGERVHLLHTGGLQGWRGFYSRGLLQTCQEISAFIRGNTPREDG